MLPEELIEADDARMERRRLPVDCVTGLRAGGERLPLELPDYFLPLQYLPAHLSGHPLVRNLAEAGSVARSAEAGGVAPEFRARELLLLRLREDFPFWAATTVRIKCKGGGPDVPFLLNPPQRRLVETFESARVAGRPIRLILLKARQWGGSTCAQLYMAWLQLMHAEGLNSLIIAHQVAGTDEIKDMFDRMMASYPASLLRAASAKGGGEAPAPGAPKMRRVGKSGNIFRVMARNCKVKVGTAERPDSCRGGDYNLVHLSEVGIWRNTDGKSPEDIVRSACGGVLLRPLTMIVYESTANGTGNFFHREYVAAARGESQFGAMFVSWYEIDAYTLPFACGEERLGFAARLLEGRGSESESSRTASGKYLWSLWERGATLEAIHWYVMERAKYNDHSRMASEYPTDDVEAFAHSGSRVFDRYRVEALRAGCRDPQARGEVVSPFPDGPESLSGLRFEPAAGGGLEVWDFPAADGSVTDRYLTVVDIGGRSSKADYSVVCVIDRAPMAEGRPPAVAAQWRGHCDTDLLAWRAARIAAWYADSLLVIESNTLETRERDRLLDDGQSPYVLMRLQDAYPNLYSRQASAAEGSGTRLGFHTNTVTKPMIITTLIRVVREGLYEERSHAALDEYLTYERRPNGSYGSLPGTHDDMLMTRAIGLHIALHEMEPPRLRVARTRRGSSRPMTESTF
ncbi:MAG: terminase [Bacteroides sp.]|nr:terminase [Bacteroides sp.]